MDKYVLIQWPDSQMLMEEPWFEEEAILELEGRFGPSAYFVPVSRLSSEKTFTQKQVFDLLLSMQQALTPFIFTNSKELDTIDFADLPICKAQELGIEEEYKEWANAQEDFLEKY